MSKQEPMKVPVSLRALMQRINRILAKDSERLCKARTERERLDRYMGPFYLINESRNELIGGRLDPEELGRNLGALKPWEYLDS